MSTVTEQISKQIEGVVSVQVYFADNRDDYVSLIHQKEEGKDRFWVQPAFSKPRRCSEQVYDDLVSQFTDEQRYNTDPEVIRSGMNYDEFMNKYYNDLPSIG